MPQTHIFKSSKRAIVMEFVRGHKIDAIEDLKTQFGNDGPLKASKILIDVFG